MNINIELVVHYSYKTSLKGKIIMLSIITFNLRYHNLEDGKNAFMCRATSILSSLAEEKPDMIGFQEMTDEMLPVMKNGMPDYTFVGHGREADLHGEHTCIAFRTDRFILNSSKTFWLSPSPDEPGSRFEGQNRIPRICTCAMLEYIPSGIQIALYNTHLDHLSAEIRKHELDLILNYIADNRRTKCHHVFFIGDFNMTPEEPQYKDIMQFDRLPLTEVTQEILSTFHDFGRIKAKKIDYIFTDITTAQGIKSARAIHKEKDGVYLSDHDAVCVDWELKEGH